MAVAKNIYIRTNAERTSGTAVAKNIYIRTNDERISAAPARIRYPSIPRGMRY